MYLKSDINTYQIFWTFLIVVSENDCLDFSSSELALLQDSQNIEFVVEDSDEEPSTCEYFWYLCNIFLKC